LPYRTLPGHYWFKIFFHKLLYSLGKTLMLNKITPFLSIFQNRFFRSNNIRSLKAKKNILASFVIRGANILIGIIIVPLTINYVNPTSYGIWLTLSSLISWFTFFDIGLGNGLRNNLTEAIAINKFKLARIYVSTTYALLSFIVIFIFLFFLIINRYVIWYKILNAPSYMEYEINKVVFIVITFFCIQFVIQLLSTIVLSNQQPALASTFDLIGKGIAALIIFLLTKFTKGSLIYLGLTWSSATVFVLIISSIILFSSKYKKLAPSIYYIKVKYSKKLLTLGLRFFIIQIAVLINYQSANIIIAQLFGPLEVTSYNIAYKYFAVITMVFTIIMMPFWSAFTEAWAIKDYSWIKSIMKKLRTVWVLLCLLGFIMLILSPIVYKFWVGKSIQISIAISISMYIYISLNCWCGIFSHFLNGVGKIQIQLYSAILSSVVNIPLSIFLGKLFGVSGVVFASVMITATAAVWAPIQYHKLINNNANGLWNK
jgi:O-antigen/teichoic acid export membrane protein